MASAPEPQWRVVDFAPGCPYEALSHPIWPVAQGKYVLLDGTAPHDQHEHGHSVRVRVPCDDDKCIFDHPNGRFHRAYFRPDELRFYEEPDD